jgi:3-phenylpropionate/trans-cinnamate dioxygenase ferredoxin subunit
MADDFIEVMSIDGLDDGAMTQVEVDGHKMLVANVAGEFFVADTHCPHLHANLTKGTLEGTVVTCPLHHSQFDLTDGHNVRWTDWEGAAKSVADFTRHPRPLRVFETKIDDGTLYMGPQKEPPAAAG